MQCAKMLPQFSKTAEPLGAFIALPQVVAPLLVCCILIIVPVISYLA